MLGHYLAARRRVAPDHFRDRAALEAHQLRLLRRVLARAPRRYAYYADLGTGPAGRPAELSDLPVLDKPDVLRHFAGLNRRGLSLAECLAAARAAETGRDFTTTLGGLSVGLSSGTSGQQTAFLTSPAERDRWAGEVLARALPRGLLAGARVTLVLRAGGPLYESVDGGRVSFSFVDLALPPDLLVASVVAARPTVLVAPPSVLRMVAREWGGRPAPERVLSAAEVLEPADAAEITAGLGVRVDQVYQAAEGFLGMSCREGTLHLAEDLVLVEREPGGDGRNGRADGDDGVDGDDGRFVPVVTDLVRSSQAVLRRRLGDVLVPGTCGCGDVRLAVREIVGRSDDALLLPRADDPATRAPFYPDFVRAAVLAAPGVADFRVVQQADDAGGPAGPLLRLAVEPRETFDAAAASLRERIGRAGLVPPTIVPMAFEPHDRLRKLRRVRRA
ncbi:MAG: hypothetical protein BGO96_07420 [Micrococcales bacterium 73-15]|nr:MAG: hypothetical protein BGO96_07420 [Micrococcales bacterium 73-15]